MRLDRLLLLVPFLAVSACEATKTGSECVQSDLIAQCPPGSDPVLGASASQGCSGQGEASLITQDGAVTAQCHGSGECRVLCQFQVPCSCGVDRVDKTGITCTSCANQSCGDGRCEGTERAVCAPGVLNCSPCAEDCTGPTCGDGDCTGAESPATCPQDCARECVPGDPPTCAGTVLVLCNANGTATRTDCAASGQVCGKTGCVVAGVCGNQVCDTSESPSTCPTDCASACVPNARSCEANTLVVCQADGSAEVRTDCAMSGEVCSNGGCVVPNLCGNGRCDAGEDPASCPSDCQIVCGNRRCETGEMVSCPADCTVCGNGRCEAMEQDTCPQDCGVCVPGARACLGTRLQVCNANGTAQSEVECNDQGQTCGRGNCVPANVCGNGVCETSDGQSCPADCAERCGDGVCGASENFSTCSSDCDHVCGDGVCDVSERPASCPQDCQVSCGNQNCDTFERDANGSYCASDCGFCGDGVCQDGFESASDRPVGGLVPCPADCVVLACAMSDDCDDRIACTADSCEPSGLCLYVPVDNNCTRAKCLGRLSTNPDGSGCCADQDGDGFASTACGGNDCNDRDNLTKPGAIEACGGPDRNCNGSNRPAMTPVLQLTNTIDGHEGLTVAAGAGKYLASWVQVPLGSPQLAAAFVRPNGTMDQPVVLDDDAATAPLVNAPWFGWLDSTYSSGRGEFAVSWMSSGGRVSLQWVDTASGTAVRSRPLEISRTIGTGHHPYDRTRFAFAYNGGTYLWAFSVGNLHHFATDDEIVGTGDADTWRAYALAPVQNQFVELTAQGADGGGRVLARIRTVSKAGAVQVSNNLADGTLFDSEGGPMAWDGGAVLVAYPYGVGVRLQRITVAGAVLTDETIDPGFGTSPRVYDLVFVPDPQNPASGRVAILFGDGRSLWFMVRALDGTKLLDAGQIAVAPDARYAHLFFDGSNFVAFWVATQAGVGQIYTTTIGCQ